MRRILALLSMVFLLLACMAQAIAARLPEVSDASSAVIQVRA